MRRTFILAVASLIALDIAFMRRWERLLQLRSHELDVRSEAVDDLRDRLDERDSILSGMFSALAEARSALLRSIEQLNMQIDDDDPG